MVDFDRTAFIEKFQEEAQDLLQRLNESAIRLEAVPDEKKLIEGMLRDAHTLKGSARMVGLIEISDLAHHLEDIMVQIRDGKLVYSSAVSDCFFEAFDAVMFLTAKGGTNVAGELDLDKLQKRLASCLVREDSEDSALEEAGFSCSDPAGIASDADEDGRTSVGDGHPGPPAEADAASISDVAPTGGSSGSAASSGSSAKAQSTVRVRTNELDSLLNMVGEVVIGQVKGAKQVSHLRSLHLQAMEIHREWSCLRAALSKVDLQGWSVGTEDVEQFDRLLVDHECGIAQFVKTQNEDTSRASAVISDLQQQSMRMRMLPANTVFQAYPRTMRNLAKDVGKEIEFEIEGGETEVDKKVLEQINDPLVHLMRNAVGHGIEDPLTRIKRGKPAKGKVRVAMHQEGDRIVIEVSDDGAGIDPEAIKAAAVRRGYIAESNAEALSDREAMYLIFEAGFSTSTIITELSGRGVGMDVVRELIVEKLKGSLDVYSKLGEGTQFRLTVPLTLAIIRAFVLRVGNRYFALPTASVEETLLLDPSEIQRFDGREVIRRGRRAVPLVHLADLLGIREHGHPEGKVPIVSIGHTGYRFGFVVDEFESEQQIVIKPLGKHFGKVSNIAGVTVAEEGEIVPILHVPDMIVGAHNRTGRSRSATRGQSAGPRQRRVLICEDSFTTRELERSIFEAAGYYVETANDALAGLTKLREGLKVDIIVSDVQMPNMTGFELAKAIKSDPEFAHLPVVIVTSLERDEEKALGIEAGADAYITKSVFNQGTLLDTVEHLTR
ncbi:MAG: hybrid sensor histidine kinase/response regulator [Coriobacteriia bacterium]|nr:hybrid sensor histidine kinase/response regulator [Coriobacteriia bacterium]